ncbi:MAG: DUF3095 domain-containing protein [Pseudomonadota bacterium]
MDTEAFLASIPVFDRFEEVADLDRYVPLPDGWSLAMADIVGSTEAIAQGAYRAVNMAGAAVIPAISNALGMRGLPFVFAGDGAFVALPPGSEPAARTALAALRTWTAEDLGLRMRIALVPVSEIRLAGQDVRLARYRASPLVAYAMVSGGGAAWAEQEMKRGRFGVAEAPNGARPDLSGLSCRWAPVRSRHGQIVSVIVVPARGAAPAAFARLVADLAELSSEEESGGNPIPAAGPPLSVNGWGVGAEARLAGGPAGRFVRRIGVWTALALVMILYRTNRSLGGFDARSYARDIALNADFRKFDDGLKMTIDVAPQRLARIEARLSQAEADGTCRFALLPQDSALMTCIVPTPRARDHMHFIDGGSGGYAAVARLLKASDGRADGRADGRPDGRPDGAGRPGA